MPSLMSRQSLLNYFLAEQRLVEGSTYRHFNAVTTDTIVGGEQLSVLPSLLPLVYIDAVVQIIQTRRGW